MPLVERLTDSELVEDALGDSEVEGWDGDLVRLRVRVGGTVTTIDAEALREVDTETDEQEAVRKEGEGLSEAVADHEHEELHERVFGLGVREVRVAEGMLAVRDPVAVVEGLCDPGESEDVAVGA